MEMKNPSNISQLKSESKNTHSSNICQQSDNEGGMQYYALAVHYSLLYASLGWLWSWLNENNTLQHDLWTWKLLLATVSTWNWKVSFEPSLPPRISWSFRDFSRKVTYILAHLNVSVWTQTKLEVILQQWSTLAQSNQTTGVKMP